MKSVLQNIILALTSLLVMFLVVEGVLRVLPNPPIPLGMPDKELGYIYRPNLARTKVDAESGKLVTNKINSYGFRDDEWDAGARPNIMVVGDSFTSAEGVEEGDRFTELLEKTLRVDGSQIHVLNFGIAGSGPEAYIERVRKFTPVFNPEWVIIVIFNGNDLQNLNYDLTPASGRKNYMVRDGEVIAYRDTAGVAERFKWEIKTLLGKSYLIQLAKDVQVKLKAKQEVQETKSIEPLPGYCEVPTQDLENSFLILKKLLADTNTLSQHRLLVVSIPDKQQLRQDVSPICDPELIEKQLYEMTKELEIPFTALLPRFKESDGELYFAGHLNERGHEIAAEVLYEAFNQD